MATPICKQCTTFGHVDIQCPAKGIWVPKTTLTPEGGEENEQGKKTNAEFKGKQVNGDAKENDDDTSEIDSGGGEVVEEVPDRGKESEMGESSKQEPELVRWHLIQEVKMVSRAYMTQKTIIKKRLILGIKSLTWMVKMKNG